MTLARTYLEMSMPDEAVEPLKEAFKTPQFRFEAAAMLGRLHQQRGDVPQAIEWLERAAGAPAPTRDEGHARALRSRRADRGERRHRPCARASSSSCRPTPATTGMWRSVSSASPGSKPEADHFLLDASPLRCLLPGSWPDPDRRAVVLVLGPQFLRRGAARARGRRRESLRARGGDRRRTGDAARRSRRPRRRLRLQTGDAEPAVAADAPVRPMTAGLSRPVFCLVTERSRLSPATDSELVRLAGHAAAAGVTLIQVRERDADGGRLLSLTRAVIAAVAGTGRKGGRQRSDRHRPGRWCRRSAPACRFATRGAGQIDRPTGFSDRTVRSRRRRSHQLPPAPVWITWFWERSSRRPASRPAPRGCGPEALERATRATAIPVLAIGGSNRR